MKRAHHEWQHDQGSWDPTRLLCATLRPDDIVIADNLSSHKALLRCAAVRKVDVLWDQIGKFLDRVPPHECSNYFKA